MVLAALARGETLEEAARGLAKRISAHLAPGETCKVAERNLSSLTSAETSRARTAIERALRQPAGRSVVEIALTIAASVRGYLLVAEIRRGEERVVEMVDYRPNPAPRHVRPALSKRLLWEQDDPILDLMVTGDELLVLDSAKVTVYGRRPGTWETLRSQPITAAAAVRDPRGRMEVSEASLAVHLPGYICRGTWTPALELNCQTDGAGFAMDGEQVRLSRGRNTLESNAWSAFYSYARAGELQLVAEPDGRTHVYDREKKPVDAFELWGSDFVSVEDGCAAGRRILAAAGGDRQAADSVALYDIADRKPQQASDRLEFPGPVTAMWPAAVGAVAIVRNLSTGRYAGYSLTVDCGR